MKTMKIFAAVVIASVVSGCMSLRGIYEYNGTPYEAHNGDVELRVMNDPTENQIKDIYRQMEDSGYVEIGRVDAIKSEEEATAELTDILTDICSLRGNDYLSLIKRRLESESIVVTIEKR